MYAGIFLMFAPVGVLMMMVQQTPMGWAMGLASGIFSGLMSVGWAHMFIRERWWLAIPLVAVPILLPSPFFAWFAGTAAGQSGMELSPQARLIVLALLCVAFTAAGFVLSVMHQRRSERSVARTMAEFELAAQVHETLAPPLTLTTPLGEVLGRSEASSTMGGDLIDAVVEGEHLDVLLGDVSGHGVGAGIVMAMLKSCIRTRLLHGADLGSVVEDANRVLTDLTAPNMFATLVALRLRPGGVLEFALAGHLPVLHYRAAEKAWVRHPNQNLPLGIDHAERFVAGSTTVGPGDVLAVFTDGLTEVQDGAGRELGLEGVAALLARAPMGSLAAMHEAVMAGVAKHGPRLDDQSLVLVRVA
jgi:serine phosphatase RsbU (regulator of sigma subunit)